MNTNTHTNNNSPHQHQQHTTQKMEWPKLELAKIAAKHLPWTLVPQTQALWGERGEGGGKRGGGEHLIGWASGGGGGEGGEG